MSTYVDMKVKETKKENPAIPRLRKGEDKFTEIKQHTGRTVTKLAVVALN